ncbi:uncharacterized protein [Euphorbia lathyris]|uniref:uncharacterized protein isoform X2 n=1 Tax=Euphorbia lathyris TaxID=212925 RepID=UPI0033142D97
MCHNEFFQMCQNCCQDSHMGSRECSAGDVKNADYSCLLSCPATPQLSTVSRMSEIPVPNFVYLRRKQQGKPVTLSSAEAPAVAKRSGEECLSVISSDAPSVAVRELHMASQSVDANENPFMPPTVVNKEPSVFKSEPINGCSHVKELGSDTVSKYSFFYRRKNPQCRYAAVFSAEAPCLSVVSSDSPSNAVKELHVASQSYHIQLDPVVPSTICKRGNHVSKSELMESNETSKIMKHKIIEVDSNIESCSSSKSDTELVSTFMRTEVDDSVDSSSSSSVMAAELLEEGMSEKDLFISIHRSQGVLHGTSPSRNNASAKGVGDSSASSSSRLCKICSRPDSTLKMLICDNCEEAFHLFCCNPQVKRIPLDEWFCHSCSKKRRKILKETISSSPSAIGEKGRCLSYSIDESNPIVLMLLDTGPYSSGVRYGKGFQAEVPEWSGPITNDIDKIPEPLEIDPSDFVISTLNFNKPSKLSSIGNWLQCREVIDGAGESDNGTICGKWRRAPLCEVQTDDWECFCSVLWDPIHADCAAPQELETEQVLKQLKLIQMLRRRLHAKRPKRVRRKKENDSIEAIKQQQQKPEQQNPHGTIMYRRYTHGRNKVSFQN